MNETTEHKKTNVCLADQQHWFQNLVLLIGGCLPEFHSPSIFASLLDHERGGFFVIQPSSSFQSAHHYLPETNVVETIFEMNREKCGYWMHLLL